MKKLISIVTPTFNEEQNIEKLSKEISIQMQNLNYDYEHIIIDNASTDNTQEIIKKLCANDKRIKAIFNTKNFGHIRSPYYAILQSKGDGVIVFSSDFQDPPILISQLVDKWTKGSEIVLLKRKSSQENFILKLFKKLFYKLIRLISETSLTEGTTGSGIFSKRIIEELRKIKEPYPYFRGLITEITGNIDTIEFDQPRRSKGNSKNNFFTLFDIGILGIIKHSRLPLRFMTISGFVLSFFSLLIGLFFFTYKILFWNSFQLGLAPLILGLFFGISFQVFMLGIIGEYVGLILIQTRQMPLVIEKERINF
jgi:glycosyltransferase involved in cell wall biosynthesis